MLPWLIGAAIVGFVAAVSSSDDTEKKAKEAREAEERAERRRAEKAAEERAAKEMALKQASKLREVRTQISALLDSAVESLDSLYEVSLDSREFSLNTIEKIRYAYDKEVFERDAIESVLKTSIQNDLMFFQEELGGKLKSTRKLQNRCEAIRELEKEKADIAKLLVAITNKAVQLSS